MKKLAILLTFLMTMLMVSPALGALTSANRTTSTDLQEVRAAQVALYKIGCLYPVQGTDANIVSMTQAIVNKASYGVKVSIIYNYNKQVANDGAIIYGPSQVAGNITFRLTKGTQYVSSTCYVVVPASKNNISAPAATQQVCPATSPTTVTATTVKANTAPTVSTSTLAVVAETTTAATSASTNLTAAAADPSGTLNVKDYGAKGDGVTNDASAFNSAISAASAQGGGTVFVPPGTYRISMSNGITMKSNVTLSMYNATLFDHAVVSGRSMITISNGVSNVKILGGVIEGPAQSAGASENYNSGITMWESPSNITVKDLEIRYFMCDGMYLGCATSSSGAPNGVLVEGCYIHHCGRNGLSLISHRNATYKDNEISYIGLNSKATSYGAGFKFEANSSGGKNWVGENIRVEGNNVHHCHVFGICVSDYWDRSNPYHPVSITVQNNEVHDNATLGTGSYSVNADNCLEFATGSASRWVKWDGTMYNSSQQSSVRSW